MVRSVHGTHDSPLCSFNLRIFHNRRCVLTHIYRIIMQNPNCWVEFGTPWAMWTQQGDRVIQEDPGLCKEVGGGGAGPAMETTEQGQMETVSYKGRTTITGWEVLPQRKKMKITQSSILRMKCHHQWEPRRWWDRPAADYVMATANLHGKAREGIFIFSFS